jgi:hypothetical protein
MVNLTAESIQVAQPGKCISIQAGARHHNKNKTIEGNATLGQSNRAVLIPQILKLPADRRHHLGLLEADCFAAGRAEPHSVPLVELLRGMQEKAQR